MLVAYFWAMILLYDEYQLDHMFVHNLLDLNVHRYHMDVYVQSADQFQQIGPHW